jgi:hypothetical protein
MIWILIPLTSGGRSKLSKCKSLKLALIAKGVSRLRIGGKFGSLGSDESKFLLKRYFIFLAIYPTDFH